MTHFHKKPKSVPVVAVNIDGVMIPPLTVSRSQAAALLGCDVKTIDRAITARLLKASKLGDRVLIKLAHLEKMLDANPA